MDTSDNLSSVTATPHPDFDALRESWTLALDSDGYARNTLLAYPGALAQLAAWLAVEHPGVGPLEMTTKQLREWIVHVRDTRSSGTARSWFAGIRHFCRWMVAEGERDDDATASIKTPPPNDPTTPTLSIEEIRTLLKTCTGRDFRSRRDAAILYTFTDTGMRLAEVAGLAVADVDLRTRSIVATGKGSNRSGPRRRIVPLGVKAAQAMDRYLRERRKHPYAELPQLWLGARNRANLSADGIERMLQVRATSVGIRLHPHMFRHSWASQFRRNGGDEGDLMVLGGWSNRTMLDRYGRAEAAERAAEAYRKRSLGDRI